MKVCFETFGCRLNKAEALQMEADYLAKGWEIAACHAEADLIVVRGCSVTSRAQRDCEKLIAHLRKHYPKTSIRVCGCLDTLEKRLAQRANSEVTREDALATAESPVPTRTARAYLKIQDGCSGKCSFCIVPHFRGKSVSTPFDELLARADRFIEAGYREIVLTGCNLALYASGGKRLPQLVDALAARSEACRIRLGSLEPGACALETVSAAAAHENVCRFFHVPIQSGSNRVLSAMRRPYVAQDVMRLADEIVRVFPMAGIGCDLIAGFPDETENDHLSTVGLVERLPLSNAHVFPYSERPGTLAAGYPESVPHRVRSSRAHELARLVDAKRRTFAKKFIGRTVDVVIEDEQRAAGWTSEYLWCKAAVPARLNACGFHRKDLVRFHVSSAHGGVLTGEVLHGR